MFSVLGFVQMVEPAMNTNILDVNVCQVILVRGVRSIITRLASVMHWEQEMQPLIPLRIY